MNYFTKLSIELASQRDYLDQLYRVYPIKSDNFREIDEGLWEAIAKSYNSGDNEELIKLLLQLPLFPVKDGYVPFLKLDTSAIGRNPNTVNRICGRIKDFDLEKLHERCLQPKETNRQMGPLFRNWLKLGTLGVTPVDKETFLNTTDNAVLDGSDKVLKEFAMQHLGYKRDKGLDFVGRFNGKYVIGEAKFISDEGGHQNDQFVDACATLDADVNEGVVKIGILDGVLYIKSKKKMFTYITSNDVPIMSALVLRDFLYTL